MLTYLVISAGVSFIGAFVLYQIIQTLVKRGRVSRYQGRGFFVIALALWIFTASALDYFLASPYALTLSQEQRVVPMMLVNAGICLVWLLWGSANFSQDDNA